MVADASAGDEGPTASCLRISRTQFKQARNEQAPPAGEAPVARWVPGVVLLTLHRVGASGGAADHRSMIMMGLECPSAFERVST